MMKKIYFTLAISLILLLCNSLISYAQAPEGFTYQAEARDAAGKLLVNKTITVKSTILAGAADGLDVWNKTYTLTTDKYGLFSMVIGDAGTETSFSKIDWSTGKYFLNVQIKNGTTWINTGTTQLLSVPYALYAKTAGSTKITETDPVFNASPSAGISGGNISDWNTAFGWGNHAGLYKPFNWIPSWADVTGKPVLALVATSGSYNDLTDKPVIPTVPVNVSAFTNDAGYLTSSQGLVNLTESNYSYGSKTGVKLLATNVATDVDLVISSKGTGAILAQQPDGTAAGGTTRGLKAIDLQMSRYETTEVASGDYSFIAGGMRNTASGNFSFAAGAINLASGYASTAMGRNNTASSHYTVALGFNNTASGIASTALGLNVQATGNNSTAIGNYATAPSAFETAIGRYNTDYTPASTTAWDSGDRLFTVGNGTGGTAKSNALTILKNANTTIGGSLTINGNGNSIAFPTTRGTSGQFLITDGNGAASWYTPNYLTSYTETDPVVNAVNGLVKSDGTAISAAVAGIDYLAPGQAVTQVTGTGPIVLSGGTTPVISINPATSSEAGSMSATDKTKLDAHTTGTALGQMQYWNGTAWVTIAAGTVGQILTMGASGIPEWHNQISKPKASSTDATNITSTTAILNGVVNAMGLSTTVTFEYGLTTSYGSTIDASQSPVSGNTDISVSANLSSLAPLSTYHFRIKAENAAGTFYSSDLTLTTLLAVGDNYQGGKVAYILQPGDPGYVAGEMHGLIAAPSDQAMYMRWDNKVQTQTEAWGTAIGTGNENTNIIVSKLGEGSYAAKLCYDLVLGGYSDWYLPSKNELIKLYENRLSIGMIEGVYWTSSEIMFNSVWYVSFYNGNVHYYTTNVDIRVRAVRSF